MERKNLGHPFMTMMLTSVTAVGLADVPDSDRGDYRRRRAIDISSYFHYITVPGYFPYIHFYSCVFSLLSSGWFVIALCGPILVQGAR